MRHAALFQNYSPIVTIQKEMMKAITRNKVITTTGDATVIQSLHEGWVGL